jgi:hypothetical protein
MSETVFVTGCVNVVPGTPFADEVKQAFVTAEGRGQATFYVLGSLFAPGTSKDAMIVYLDSLPGRKVLVTDKMGGSDEARCGAWHEVHDEVLLQLWSREFRLAEDPPRHVAADDGLLIHVGRRIDSATSVRVLWSDWQDRFGPGGLNNLYALSVLAEQIGAGMVAVEPEDGR